MNKNNAKDYLPLVQALADGKTIQIHQDGEWEDYNHTFHLNLMLNPDRYRIKPEPAEYWLIVANNNPDTPYEFHTNYDNACNSFGRYWKQQGKYKIIHVKEVV
jgi:hypothetical protein